MRQMCPNCSRLIELPETAAGTETACPECGKTFRVPGSYTPSVDPTAGPVASPSAPTLPPAPTPAAPTRPVPPPGFVPPAPPAPTTTDPSHSAYAKSADLLLKPNIIVWIPAVCLTLTFLLSFFAWVGSYPGGSSLYTQSPWGALFAKFSVSSVDPVLLQDEPAIRTNIHTSWLLAFYFPLLLLTLAIVWAERVLSLKFSAPPAPLASVWPLRFTILAGLAIGVFLILLMQAWQGFGLELAIQKTIDAKYAEAKIQANDTKKTSEITRVEIQAAQDFAKYALQGTTALSLSIAAHVLAVVALLLAWWLDRRGTKPPPRVALYW